MKGNTLQEFMDDLLTCGGPEKEFVYKDKYYIIQGDTLQPEGIPGLKLDIYTRNGDEAGEYIQSMFSVMKMTTKVLKNSARHRF